MKNEHKSKEQLISELVNLRADYHELQQLFNRIPIRDRVKLEQLVAEHNKELKRARHKVFQNLESITDCFFSLDKDWRFTYVNNATTEIWGESREDLIGQVMWEKFPYLVGTPFYNNYFKAMKEQIPVQFEALGNINHLWVLVHAYPSSEGLSVFFHNINDRVIAEEKIRESEEKYRNLYETMAQGIIYFGCDGDIIDANPAAQKILGLSLEHMKGRTSFDPSWKAMNEYGTPLTRETDPVILTIKTGQPVNNVIIGLLNPLVNDYRWINISTTPKFKPGDKKPYQVYTTFDDITERKHAEELKNLNQQRLEALVKMNNMNDNSVEQITEFILEKMVSLTGSDIGYFGFINEEQTQCEMIACTKNVMKNCRVKDDTGIYSVTNGGIWAEAIREQKVLIINDYSKDFQSKRGLPQGHIPLSRALIVPIFSGNRLVMNAVVGNKKSDYNQTDANQLTLLVNGYWSFIQQKKHEEEKLKTQWELKRLDHLKLVGQMAAGISHEVRNPMTTVRGFLQILQSKEECSKYRDYFNLMIEELDRANSIITEFLTIGKNKSEELKMQNINQIVNAIVPLIQADAVGQDKYVDTEINEVPELLLDSKEIRQLIFNLCRNGLEAMETGKSLTIRTYREDDCVVLAVQDQGKGISSEVLEKLGTPFFTTKGTGTGLGLGICYGIVARHKAKLDIQTSTNGTTFYVRFIP